MSDEEKEALEILKSFEPDDLVECAIYLQALERITNLIEKQQKEIEELKRNNKTLKNLQNDTNRLYIEMTERKNYFERELQKVEDKIKAKIEEYEEKIKKIKEKSVWEEPYDTEKYVRYTNYISVLQSLLEKE